MSDFSIHPDTRIGSIHLIVSNLDRALQFYGDVLGFRLLHRRDNTGVLTADGKIPLLVLTGNPDARPKPRRTTGLYHSAILVPTRLDLARSLRRLAETRYPLGGASDHLVSEALYLTDPDGNGIEIYADRPRNVWTMNNGQVQMSTEPLDIDGLMGELLQDPRPWTGLSPQTRIGHVHLQVSDLSQAEAFYVDLLGFQVTQRNYPGALFVSAGGYHHHLGLNVWAGAGALPPPPDAVGLRYFELCLPDRAELERIVERVQSASMTVKPDGTAFLLHDPSRNGIRLSAN